MKLILASDNPTYLKRAREALSGIKLSISADPNQSQTAKRLIYVATRDYALAVVTLEKAGIIPADPDAFDEDFED